MEINLENGTLKSGTPQDLLSRSKKFFVKNEKEDKADAIKDLYEHEREGHPELSEEEIKKIVEKHLAQLKEK